MQVAFGFRRGSERASSHVALVSDVARLSTHPSGRRSSLILHPTQSMELFLKGIVLNRRHAVHEFERKRKETLVVFPRRERTQE